MSARGGGGEDRTVVVGAGVFGVTSALELRRRGHDVTLVDPGPLPHPDASSTDISKIVRADYGADAFYTAMAEEAMKGWLEWNGRWGEEVYHPEGFLVLSLREMASGGFEHESHEVLLARGHPLERVGPESLARRFPAWTGSGYRDGYFNPLGGWVESGRAMERLLDGARAAGIAIRVGTRMAGLAEEGTRVRGVRLDSGERLEAGRVIVAAGAWTPALLPALRETMWSVAQPVLHFLPDDPAAWIGGVFPPWAADVARTGWYGFPAHPRDGRVKVGNHGPGRRVDAAAPGPVPEAEEERFRAFLAETLPGLAAAPVVGRRHCLYCDTADGDFLIDRVPGREGLFVAAGGSGHGFKFAPVLGGIVADVVEERENPRAVRFRWRGGPEEARSEPARRLR